MSNEPKSKGPPPKASLLKPREPEPEFAQPNELQTPGERSTKDGAWFWANKAALERVRTLCEDSRSTLAVYFALCEIASDEQSDTFKASMDKIAAKACLSRRTVFNRLNDLEGIYLVKIVRSKTSQNFRIPSEYALLKCENAT